MSNNKMLIDAAHPEETRVVVLREGRVEEFDYESAARKLLRGNIYLAKVTRVEPSLQAAFVDYGGNRHGFLAFNEIHPDYYQIPVADRELLKQEEAAAEAEAEALAEARAERRARQQEERQKRGRGKRSNDDGDNGNDDTHDDSDADGADSIEAGGDQPAAEDATAAHADDDSRQAGNDDAKPAAIASGMDGQADTISDAPHAVGLVEEEGLLEDSDNDGEAETNGSKGDHADEANGVEAEAVDEVGTEDAMEEVAERPRRRARQYKIQEVIKRRQVLLVQVVKEERGNKGAALTTYLSLAGRYTVLMPNTGRGGGISRKITQPQDRKRLKAIASELDVPEGMGLIIRTAGAARTKQEIQRDFEYLLRLWESVRELTLESSAPNLVYEEGNLIKRSIRDLYSKEIDQIAVAGEQAHREARDFMTMLMPSHARNVVLYKDPEPLFAKYLIERQLNAMFSPYVTLKSGGYIVINQTEALVSVDVNSGKSTREFSIEETALNTNLEAAEELARQLKLRDLAGLIVIDFIDMDEKRNNRAVENKIKNCLKHDRARIQVGRISHFGLLEMSRQRMRTGVLEGSTTQCPHCSGTGVIRSTESVALGVLRALEDTLLTGAPHSLTAVTTSSVALYILNHKRMFINEMEDRYGISITVEANERMQGANFAIEKSAAQQEPQRRASQTAVKMEWGFEAEGARPEAASAAPPDAGNDGDDEGRDTKKPRRRRRRGGRSGRGGDADQANGSQRRGAAQRNGDDSGAADQQENVAADDRAGEPRDDSEADTTEARDDNDKPRRNRRRGRRGGRRSREANSNGQTGDDSSSGDIPGMGDQPDLAAAPSFSPDAASDRPDTKQESAKEAAAENNSEPARSRPAAEAEPIAPPSPEPKSAEPAPQAKEPKPIAAESAPAEPAAPSRKGWWQRAFSSD